MAEISDEQMAEFFLLALLAAKVAKINNLVENGHTPPPALVEKWLKLPPPPHSRGEYSSSMRNFWAFQNQTF
jgi:hypothetical protein